MTVLVSRLDPAAPGFAANAERMRERLAEVEWNAPAIAAALKAVLADHRLKMPQLAVPLRVLVTARTQTPSIDAVLALFPRDEVLSRLRSV